MKFKITTVRDRLGDTESPCQNAIEVSREIVTQSYALSSNVLNLPESWWNKGFNHRKERYFDIDDVAVRSIYNIEWEVEINSLDELIALKNEVQSELIVGNDYIRIYNDHE